MAGDKQSAGRLLDAILQASLLYGDPQQLLARVQGKIMAEIEIMEIIDKQTIVCIDMSKVLYQGKTIDTPAEVIAGKRVIKTHQQFERLQRDKECSSYRTLKASMGIGPHADRLPEPPDRLEFRPSEAL